MGEEGGGGEKGDRRRMGEEDEEVGRGTGRREKEEAWQGGRINHSWPQSSHCGDWCRWIQPNRNSQPDINSEKRQDNEMHIWGSPRRVI